MKRIVGLAIAIVIVSVAPLIAQTAVVEQITGKVQLQTAGGPWTDAKVGSVITQGTIVSTGFGASAVLNLGTSQLQVKQLTRMRLDELVRTQSTATTSLFLTVGQVRANVDNSLGVTQRFTLKSPVSTAAVRGTIFDFGLFGVTVERGVVSFSNQYGIGREVSRGETSELNGVYVPGSAEEFAQAAAVTKTKTSVNQSETEGTPAPAAPGNTGGLKITVNLPTGG